MAKKWVLAGLIAMLVVLGLAALGGWAYLKAIKLPFLFEVARYQLAPNWFLAEFQPIFLRQFSQDGAEYFLVAYRNGQGEWVAGKVVVGGQYQNQVLPWLPHTLANEANSAEGENQGYHYPFYPGQRIKLMFLINQKAAKPEDLGELCQRAPRACQVAKLVLASGSYQEIYEKAGLEPVMPVLAVGVSKELVSQQLTGEADK